MKDERESRDGVGVGPLVGRKKGVVQGPVQKKGRSRKGRSQGSDSEHGQSRQDWGIN
jgi:hypothetical protein